MDVFLIMAVVGLIILFIVTLVILPIQYKYIEGLEEMKKKSGKTQGEIYEEMSPQEQVLHRNAQANILFIPANIIAHIIYKRKHKKESK